MTEIDWKQRAEAAEAKLAQLTAEGRSDSRAPWQPIASYVPSMGEQVWTWDAERGSNPSMLCDGVWLITYDDSEIHPTHWMSLPDPPSASTEEPQ